VALNRFGQIDTARLKVQIENSFRANEPILAAVSVCGTTELGTIDPIHEINELLKTYKKERGYTIWHHVDAAYGGFFAATKNCIENPLEKSRMDLLALENSTSISIDPHKLGYVPYASGAFLCRDQENYFCHEISAPYIDFKQETDRGPYTIEGSRSAAGAVAMYLTAECIGLDHTGYGSLLSRTVRTRNSFHEELLKEKLPFFTVDTVGTNILCLAAGRRGENLTEVNKRTVAILNAIQDLQAANPASAFFVSRTTLGSNFYELIKSFCETNEIAMNDGQLSVIRLTFMNPFLDSIHPDVNYKSAFFEFLRTAHRGAAV
jgi:glutamate/tyrosine decarboxylase-like PLP-dependent enzyme